ncbi:MAG: baseplate J/gp47 family protein [Acidobacteriota bacterium]
MARTTTLPQPRPRDGTSQASRIQQALDPDYVGVDERRLEDLLEFARRFGKQLRFYDLDNRPAGDWGSFVDPRLDWETVRSFVEGSWTPQDEAAATARGELLRRPHFALFLTFLKLLESVQGELNALTRRHLDFYYRRVLCLGPRPAVPDRVTLLFELAPDLDQALVPAGSLLSAGPDAEGIERLYATDRDLIVNPIAVAELRSLHVVREGDWTVFQPTDDATGVHPQGTPGDSAASWRTFGQAPAPLGEAGEPPEPKIGWAIASRLLELHEGRRTLSLSLGFHRSSFDRQALERLLRENLLSPESPLRLECSGEAGWFEPRRASGFVEAPGTGPQGWEDLDTLRFELELGPEDAPLVALPDSAPALSTSAVPAPAHPMVRWMLRPIWRADRGQYWIQEGPLAALRLAAVHLRVEAADLSGLQLESDGMGLDPESSFEPFGATPGVGARLQIAHPELAFKPLDHLRLHLEWLDLPEDLSQHYRHYDLGSKAGEQPPFTSRVRWVDSRRARTLAQDLPLFATARTAEGGFATASKQTLEIPWLAAEPASARAPRQGEVPGDVALRWELEAPDFQHHFYPEVASRWALAMASALVDRQTEDALDPESFEVPAPYTPRLQSLRLDYVCSAEIRLDPAAADSLGLHRLHVHPWGMQEIDSDYPHLLPSYDNEGELYLGLSGVQAPQTVSLAFQLAEGSADLGRKPEGLSWSYLSGDRWIDFEDGSIPFDSTHGLLNSGILELALEPAAPGSFLPSSLMWIRAAVRRHAAGVCDAVAIQAQAMSATFQDQGNAPQHFDAPLEAECISQFVAPQPEIAGIRQPTTSYGGRRAEAAAWFNTRVSERLRHKGRALSMWDYERLVLERFPEIYKAKCLPATPEIRQRMGISADGATDGDRRFHDRGGVWVIVCPNVRNQVPFDPFEPKVRADLLLEIERYLAERAPASASIEVRNAHYVAVRVKFAVRFKHQGNDGFYRNQLHDELCRHLSSWAYEEGADIVVGGRIYANNIVDFLDRRPYVDFVADLELSSSEDGESFRPAAAGRPEEGHFVSTSRPDGVLLAAREHQIDLIPETSFAGEHQMGLHFMQVELDLQVT